MTTQDSNDIYSIPQKATTTNCSKIFELPVRKNINKPGRELQVTFDSRMPLVSGFECSYSYIVKFDRINSSAGGHYHLKKQEIYIPILGKFTVLLKDINTDNIEEVVIDSELSQSLYVRTNIAHKVTALTDKAILLVHATAPNSESDEILIEF